LFKIQKNIIKSLLNEELNYFKSNAKDILTKESRLYDPNIKYDIFLSHCYKDANLILGIKRFIENHIIFFKRRLKVYVDWIDDTDLSAPHC
jgi:hypothetical protein